MTIRIIALVVARRSRGLSARPPSSRLAAVARAERDGISKETGLLQQWPAAGPSTVWTASGLGNGYGSVAVQGQPGLRPGAARPPDARAQPRPRDRPYVWSKNLGDRRPTTIAAPVRAARRRSTAIGCTCSPKTGLLVCLRAADGTAVWQRNILRDFAGRNIQWLVSESPLVDGDQVIVTPGGRGAGHGGARQDDGQDDLDGQGIE